MRPLVRGFVALACATALRCGATNPAPPAPSALPAPAAPLSAAELARSYGLSLQSAPADGVPIRVVDAASGRPVDDALVVSIDEYLFTYADVDYDDGETRTARSLLRREGCATATSADGVARVAAATAPLSVFVWSGGKFGRTTLEVHDRSEHVVPIAPRSLRVEVVDASGRPQAGVPIQMAKCSLEPMATGTTVGTTGADGVFDVPALELERGVHRTCGRRDLVMLGALVAGGELRAADAPVLEPVRFVLPECGSVEVVLQDAQGRPLRTDAAPASSVGLFVEGSWRPGAPASEWVQDWPERSLEVPFVDGRCRLDRVELGADLGFHLEIEAGVRSYTDDELRPLDAGPGADAVTIRGPTKSGEVVHVVLRAGWFGAPAAGADATAATDPATAETAASSAAAASESNPPADARSSVDVSVRLDVPIDPCSLRVRLDGNRDPNEHDSNPWIDVTGRATVRNVPAGTHSIEITWSSFSDFDTDVVLHESAPFEVASAQHLREPRLLDIDLRGTLRHLRADVVDDAGRPLAGLARTSRDGEGAFERSVWFICGRADLLTLAADGVRTEFLASRCRPFLVDPRVDPKRIVLKRGIPIRIALAPGFELPAAPELAARLYVGVPEWPRIVQDRSELRSVEVRPGADLRFELAEPGRWPVVFLVGRKDGSGEVQKAETHLLDETITVEDRVDEQTFVITPDRDCWNRLVQKLRAPG